MRKNVFVISIFLFFLVAGTASATLMETWKGEDEFIYGGDAWHFNWDFGNAAGNNKTNSDLDLTSDVNMPKVQFASAEVRIKLYSTDNREEEKFKITVNPFDDNIVDSIEATITHNMDKDDPWYIWHYQFTDPELKALAVQGKGRITIAALGEKGKSDWNDFAVKKVSIGGTYAAPVPEPTTMLLLGAGLIGLAGAGRKKWFKKIS